MRPQDLEALPPARVAKDRVHVVCARTGCGVRIARLDPYEVAEAPAYVRASLRRLGVEFVVFMLPGWVAGEDGVWRMSARAWRRLSEGRAPAFRRDPARAVLERSDRRGRSPRKDRGRPVLADELPLAVRCPACRLLQRVDLRHVTVRYAKLSTREEPGSAPA